ncbi:hypothetical protein Tco_1429038 [Tanacetum coccineum]
MIHYLNNKILKKGRKTNHINITALGNYWINSNPHQPSDLRTYRMKPNLTERNEDDTKDTNSPIYDALNDIEVYIGSNPLSPQPSSPKTQQIKELNNQVLLLTSQKTLVEEKYRYQKSARANQRSLADSTDGLCMFIRGSEINLAIKIKEVPTKLQDLTTSISVLTKKVKNLEGKKLEVPTGLLELPNSTSYVVEQISTYQAHTSSLHN